MKKSALSVFLLLLLTGCANARSGIDRAMELRGQLLTSTACSFRTVVTADYGETVCTFSMDCSADDSGNLLFTVTEPETIAGITGTISQQGGELTFEDTALDFPMLADGQLAPVSGPWVLWKTLRGGYLTAAGWDDELLRLTIDDSYEENALQVDVWLDDGNCPVWAEIVYDGRRILTMDVENFTIG